eukprot:1367499-Rhodomonas_salina.4
MPRTAIWKQRPPPRPHSDVSIQNVLIARMKRKEGGGNSPEAIPSATSPRLSPVSPRPLKPLLDLGSDAGAPGVMIPRCEVLQRYEKHARARA